MKASHFSYLAVLALISVNCQKLEKVKPQETVTILVTDKGCLLHRQWNPLAQSCTDKEAADGLSGSGSIVKIVVNSHLEWTRLKPIINGAGEAGNGQGGVEISLADQPDTSVFLEFPLSDAYQIHWQFAIDSLLEPSSTAPAEGYDASHKIAYFRISLNKGILMLGDHTLTSEDVLSTLKQARREHPRVAVGIDIVDPRQETGPVIALLKQIRDAGCKAALYD